MSVNEGHIPVGIGQSNPKAVERSAASSTLKSDQVSLVLPSNASRTMIKVSNVAFNILKLLVCLVTVIPALYLAYSYFHSLSFSRSQSTAEAVLSPHPPSRSKQPTIENPLDTSRVASLPVQPAHATTPGALNDGFATPPPSFGSISTAPSGHSFNSNQIASVPPDFTSTNLQKRSRLKRSQARSSQAASNVPFASPTPSRPVTLGLRLTPEKISMGNLNREHLAAVREERAQKIGYKAANLEMLRSIAQEFTGDASFQVPPFSAIEHDEILRTIREKFPEFEALWKNFEEICREQADPLDAIAKGQPILEKIQAGIEQAFQDYDHPSFTEMAQHNASLMIRSTGREDSALVGNPGGNLSIANVKPEAHAIGAAIGKVISSYFSSHSLTQRASQGDKIDAAPFMPVLMQVMIGEKPGGAIPTSGVMFTEDRLKTPGVVEINCTYGHAEGVVTGSRPVDRLFVQGDIVHEVCSDAKTSRLAPRADGEGLEIRQNPPGANMRSSLPREQSSRLAAIGKAIEEVYGYPVDIEWSYDPDTDTLSIFQARPINSGPPLALSYINPQKYSQLGEMFPLKVIGEGTGAVAQLTHSNTLVVDQADKAAIAAYERLKKAGVAIQAVVVRNPCGSLSHEALFFKSKGVPLVCPGEGSFENVTAALRTGILLMDVQEGVAALLPEGMQPDGLVLEGLRRHMVPKQETAISGEIDPVLFKEFVEELNELAPIAKTEQKRTIEQIEQGQVYGKNGLDRWLNAYELAETPALKAYYLQRLLVLLQISIKGAPVSVQKAILGKAFYNACNLWNASRQEDHPGKVLQEKYAISWLRNVLVEERGIGIAGSDTLMSVRGEAKEAKMVDVAGSLASVEGPRREYLDVLLRSAKFAIQKDVRDDWIAFCLELSLEELQSLATLFKLLGPRVVEYWLNISFAEARKDHTSAECLQILLQEMNDPHLVPALAMHQRAAEAIRQFRDLIPGFGHPEQFKDALKALEEQLLPVSRECLEQIQTSQGLSATLLSYCLRDIVSAFDESIKAVTGSSLYASEVTRMENFYRVLQPFHEIAVTAIDPDFLSEGPALSRQAGHLKPYLVAVFQTLGERVRGAKNDAKAKALTRPSQGFVVANAMLGSGTLAPERMPVGSLEDYFTLLHQSLLTVASHTVQSKGKSLSLSDLPKTVQSLCRTVSGLNLGRREQPRPSLQSIEYSYPDVTITYNCPLNSHSASIVIHCKLEAGEVKAIDLEGQFFASLNSIGVTGRAERLFLYALDTYCPVGTMLSPEGYRPRFEDDTCRFRWKIPLEGDQEEAQTHLQRMVDFLQSNRFGRSLPRFQGVEIFRKWPEYFEPYVLAMMGENSNPRVYQMFLEGVIKFPSLQNLELFLRHPPGFGLEPGPSFKEAIRKVFESDVIWNQPDNAKRLVSMLEKAQKIDYPFTERDCERVITLLNLQKDRVVMGGYEIEMLLSPILEAFKQSFPNYADRLDTAFKTAKQTEAEAKAQKQRKYDEAAKIPMLVDDLFWKCSERGWDTKITSEEIEGLASQLKFKRNREKLHAILDGSEDDASVLVKAHFELQSRGRR